MQSTDFGSIVSPLMLAAPKARRHAKGGSVKKDGAHHLTIIIPVAGPQILGALGRAALLHHMRQQAMAKGGRR